jgi:hypothetical protein
MLGTSEDGPVVAHGIIRLTDEMPFGMTQVIFRMLDGGLYQAKVTYDRVYDKDGQPLDYRDLAVKVTRMDQP